MARTSCTSCTSVSLSLSTRPCIPSHPPLMEVSYRWSRGSWRAPDSRGGESASWEMADRGALYSRTDDNDNWTGKT